MGVAVFIPGRLSSTDETRYRALIAQRQTVGLNDSERAELKLLEHKINRNGVSGA